MTFANTNYELARDHARHCGKMQGLVYCTVERLPRERGLKDLEEIGGKFVDQSASSRVAA
jgi:hypothetical protein